MNEVDYAKQMLDNREQGISVFHSLRKMKGRLLFRLFVLFISVACYFTLNDAPAFLLIVGMVIGTTLQDIGWLQSISKAWPFTVKVINWDQVTEVARNDS
ncbi:hypothetical protein [Aliiglaciecola sp. LCG003]|uniref:hypothetical protein n=1 Tax=Aliiglaciecola sp. LCG003 TaxID=3053655 RepID=UPI0025724698|nr:hypothetical protein [Aliiglaciecola sp. LCG003]WJG10922.1 hypothetical protein QR722_07810 [Aliiglaciecola sp. LCG003]